MVSGLCVHSGRGRMRSPLSRGCGVVWTWGKGVVEPGDIESLEPLTTTIATTPIPPRLTNSIYSPPPNPDSTAPKTRTNRQSRTACGANLPAADKGKKQVS